MRDDENLENEVLFYRYFFKTERQENVKQAVALFEVVWDFSSHNKDRERFKNFIEECFDLYQNVSYHNSDHALNTLNVGVYLLNTLERFKISQTTKIVFLLACYLHDIGHPGSKEFKRDSLDLEEQHVKLVKIQLNKFRELFVGENLAVFDEISLLSDLIYSTNLIYHDEIIENFKKKYLEVDLRPKEIELEVGTLELKMLIKIADISASYKTFETFRANSCILNKEIRGNSFRVNKTSERVEIDFLKFTALPLIEVFSTVFKGYDFLVSNCKSNICQLEKLNET